MRTRDHGMMRLGDQLPLLLGFTSPQDEDDTCFLCGNQFDHAISESLPAASLMRVGLMRPDRKNRVEHQYTLPGPGFEIAVIRYLTSNVFMEFTIDVSQ